MAISNGAYGYMTAAFAGLLYGEDYVINTPSFQGLTGDTLTFGKVVTNYIGDDGKCANLKADLATLTFSTDLTASNVVNITINGDAMAPVTYADSNAATMAAIAVAIEALDDNYDATVASANVLTIETKYENAVVTVSTVTGGSAVTITPTYGMSSNQILIGISAATARSTNETTGCYELYEAANVVKSGKVWVLAGATVYAEQTAYVIVANGATQGRFTNSSSGNQAINGKFKTSGTNGTLVLVEFDVY